MFLYIMLGMNDLLCVIKFYDLLMVLLGYVKVGCNEQGVFWGIFNGNYICGLCVGVFFDQQFVGVGNGMMVVFNVCFVVYIVELYVFVL